MDHVRLTVLAAVVLAGTATGCSATAETPGPSASATTLIGRTMADLAPDVPSGAKLLVQDASTQVGRAATYQDSDRSSDRWTIVQACLSADTVQRSHAVEVLVVPTDRVADRSNGSLATQFAGQLDCRDVQ